MRWEDTLPWEHGWYPPMGWGPLKNKKERVEFQQSSLLPGHSLPLSPPLWASLAAGPYLFIMTGCSLKPWAKINPSILAGFVRSSATTMRTVTHTQILVPFSFTRSLIKASILKYIERHFRDGLTRDGNQGPIPLIDTSAHANKNQASLDQL